ncbi:MAG: winged helix-turn-helix domain-containing protein [Gammaproteobacteria bacterium]|nr:winged helix-turn-helix domain-containing protein [Gammaproteobacteria bacterium]MDH3431871.1 winged helix-turn-helix domain-containing protein [Gammaproteobacteria bacterium]
MPTKEELQTGFIIGDWEVLPARGVLRSGEREERPEPKVLEVLLALAVRDGDLVTRDDLIREVWDGRPTSDEPINRCVAQLRGHLGDRDRPHRYIETLTRRGYRLNEKVILQDPVAPAAPPPPTTTKVSNRRRIWMLLAFITAAIFIARPIVDEFFPGKVESIAVLPFDNLSDDIADQYLVSGFKAELVHSLQNVPDLAVIPGQVTYPDKEISEIAQILGVDALLLGALQREGDTLKINYQVVRGRSGITVSSGSVTGQVGETFALQGRVAVQVRDDLVGVSAQQLISANRNPASESFDRYLRGLYALERRSRGTPEKLDEAIRLLTESIAIDPNFGPAYLSLATAYALLPDYRNAPLQETHQRALKIVEQGIDIDPSIADAAGEVLGFVYQKQRQWAQAEEAYIRATTARVVDSNAFNWYSLMLAGVGRLDDALAQLLIAQKIDPSSAVINSRLGTVYTWLGNSKKANEFFERAIQLDAGGETYRFGKTLLLTREGKLDEAADMFAAGVAMSGGQTDWIAPVFAAIADQSLTATALTAIETAFLDPQLDPRLNIISRTVLDDIDGAIEVALSAADKDEFFEMDFLFIPELRQLRLHADFPVLMEKLGIQKYWTEKECRWQGDAVSCP